MLAMIERLKSERAQLAEALEKLDAALAVLAGEPSAEPPAPVEDKPQRRRRRRMTAEQKRAISERMKKSWAKRKQTAESGGSA